MSIEFRFTVPSEEAELRLFDANGNAVARSVFVESDYETYSVNVCIAVQHPGDYLFARDTTDGTYFSRITVTDTDAGSVESLGCLPSDAPKDSVDEFNRLAGIAGDAAQFARNSHGAIATADIDVPTAAIDYTVVDETGTAVSSTGSTDGFDAVFA